MAAVQINAAANTSALGAGLNIHVRRNRPTSAQMFMAEHVDIWEVAHHPTSTRTSRQSVTDEREPPALSFRKGLLGRRVEGAMQNVTASIGIFTYFIVLAVPAEAQSPSTAWHISVIKQGSQLQPDKTHTINYSTVYVNNSETGEIYQCNGTALLTPTETQPTPNIDCFRFKSPISGHITFSGPTPSITNNNPPAITDYNSYFWVIGDSLKELHFCYIPTMPNTICNETTRIH